MKVERIETGYKPRAQQFDLHRALKRFNVLVCHRRFGKTVFSINHTIARALACKHRNPQCAYIAPTYGQAKRIAWDMLKEYTKNLPGVTTHEQDLRLEIQRPHLKDKARIMLLGAENPGSIRGIYLDGVILDEYAECDPTIWSQVVRPALSDRMGWAIFIGTPKGQNHFYDVHQLAKKNQTGDWFEAVYKASETGIIAKSELRAAQYEMSDEEYAQEFECSFSAALIGSYFGKLLEEAEENKRITEVKYDAALPVSTYWDLGIGDTTAIWFGQQYRDEHRWIDYLEQSGEGLDYYVKKIKEKPYIYGVHGLPHDAAARELGTGKSRVETLQGLGLRPTVLPRHKLDDGIHAARMLIRKSVFDRVKCERGLNALRNYQRKWDAKNKIWSTKPLHNWASHGSDAFRTAAMGFREDGFLNQKPRSEVVEDYDYNIFGG